MPELGLAVRDHRRARLMQVMDEARVDALALAGMDHVEFATNHGLTVQSWERPFLLVLTRDGRSVLVAPHIASTRLAAQQARGTLWLDRTVHYDEMPRQRSRRPLVYQLPDIIAAVIADLRLGQARIGVDTASGPLARAAALLPDMRMVPVGRPLRASRLVKHRDEIETMRTAAGLADWALARYAEEIRPGRLLQEMDHRMAAEVAIEAALRVPGEDFQILRFMTLSGSAGAAPHGDGAQCGARVLDHALAVVVCNVRLNGLSIEDQRTFVVGDPGGRAMSMVAAARAATEAGLAAVVEGGPVSAVDAAAQSVIEQAGFGDFILHRTGHGIGVATHEYPEDMPFCDRAILANEVLVVEPGIYVPGIGCARYVDVVAAGTPSDVLTRAPRTFEAMRIPA